jgi:hypothetical protein
MESHMVLNDGAKNTDSTSRNVENREFRIEKLLPEIEREKSAFIPALGRKYFLNHWFSLKQICLNYYIKPFTQEYSLECLGKLCEANAI